MPTLPATLAHFDPKTVERGKAYFEQGHVTHLDLNNDKVALHAKVRGSHHQHYRVVVPTDKAPLVGHCTCPVGYNCKHVVATLFAAHAATPPFAPPYDLDAKPPPPSLQWLSALEAVNTTPAPAKPAPYALIYLLDRPAAGSCRVQPLLSRRLIKGGFGKPRPFNHTRPSDPKNLTEQDHENLFLLKRQHLTPQHPWYTLGTNQGSRLLNSMIRTQRCFWHSIDRPIRLTKAQRPLKFHWQTRQDGSQVLLTTIAGIKSHQVLCLDALWYLDLAHHHIGPLTHPLPLRVIRLLLGQPQLPASHIDSAAKALRRLLPDDPELLPHQIDWGTTLRGVRP